MLYLFDLDGTLISSYMDSPKKAYGDWAPLPGRRERLADLAGGQANQIAIITNQAGVGLGYVTEDVARRKIDRAIAAVGLPGDQVGVYVCFAHVRARAPRYRDPAQVARRKPSGAMIREAMADYPAHAALGVLYVGDREEDAQAAAQAGVPFQWAHIFF